MNTNNRTNYSNYNNQQYNNYNSYQTMNQNQQNKTTSEQNVSFGDSVTSFWKNYVNFKGVTNRSGFWKWFLMEYVIDALFMFISLKNGASLFSMKSYVLTLGLPTIWWLVILCPNLAARTRRFRDAGLSNGWIIVLLVCDYIPIYIPFVGEPIALIARLISIIFECKESVPQTPQMKRPQQNSPYQYQQQGYQYNNQYGNYNQYYRR